MPAPDKGNIFHPGFRRDSYLYLAQKLLQGHQNFSLINMQEMRRFTSDSLILVSVPSGEIISMAESS